MYTIYVMRLGSDMGGNGNVYFLRLTYITVDQNKMKIRKSLNIFLSPKGVEEEGRRGGRGQRLKSRVCPQKSRVFYIDALPIDPINRSNLYSTYNSIYSLRSDQIISDQILVNGKETRE